MKELTKQQKIKVIDEMIVLLNQNKSISLGLCAAYNQACNLLKHEIDLNIVLWTPRFRELNKAIQSEIKRTGGGVLIHYKNWTDDRINLLKKVKKQVKKVK